MESSLPWVWSIVLDLGFKQIKVWFFDKFAFSFVLDVMCNYGSPSYNLVIFERGGRCIRIFAPFHRVENLKGTVYVLWGLACLSFEQGSCNRLEKFTFFQTGWYMSELIWELQFGLNSKILCRASCVLLVRSS